MSSALLYLPYLPNVFWFRNFLKYEIIFIEREENFVKSTLRNRCEIAAVNGIQTLSIPLKGGRDHHRMYKQVEIANGRNWQNLHWHAIQSAYGRAPYFEHYAEKVKPAYEKEFNMLFDFNCEQLYLMLHLLKINKVFEFTTVYDEQTSDTLDLRSTRRSGEEIEALRYCQVFEERHGFFSNLSVLDVLFNRGPDAREYLSSLK